MSDSDFSGRLLAPVITRPRRPLSNRASTDSWSMRFSLRTMMSGARSSIRRFNRLLRLITRRYRSLRSEVAKRPPSSGTSGRSSGGITGTTSRIIHSGLLLDFRNASTTLRRLACFSCFRAHLRLELRVAVLLAGLAELVLGEQLVLHQLGLARVHHHVGFEVEHALEVAQRDVEQVADAARQPLEEPHVTHRGRQLDVAQALAAHLGLRHFDAALVADHTAVLHALVLAAQALPVGDRPEDLRAEQAIAFRLERAVVDRLRLGDFAKRPLLDLVGRRQADANGVEVGSQGGLGVGKARS